MGRRRAKYKEKNRNSRHRQNQPLTATARLLLFTLFQAGEAMSRQDLLKKITEKGYLQNEIREEITWLSQQRLLLARGKNKLALDPAAGLYTATLDAKPAGFGFAVDLRSLSGRKSDLADPHISRSELYNARHGDKILILVTSGKRGRKPEAAVLGIVEHKSSTLTGLYYQDRGRNLVVPEDPRFPFVIEIRRLPKSQDMPENGDAVLVRLDTSHRPAPNPRGTIVEVLGNPELLEVQIRMVAEKHQLPFQFSPEALLEAEQIGAADVDSGREDLRDILHYTIDGADAKDFDDAVAVSRLRNGYRLHVSIADVSAYVKPGSRLDQEAYERGNSVYFPAFVIPMLPENLSNNLCSLVPGEDRLTVSAILDFDHSGALLNKRFVRSIIRSSKRFTYDTVKRIVVDKDKTERQACKPFLTPLQWAADLAEALQVKRRNRGSVTLTVFEPDIRLGSDGGVEGIGRKERSFADQIIEEFMLAANEAVAAAFADQGLDLLYRIHEEPDPEKIREFVDLATAFGLVIPTGKATPFWYNEMAGQVENTPREHIVNSQLLRTMQQARYSSMNSGHFGLGAPCYTHFTSPIRRYPDLIVHRLLCDLLAGDASAKPKPYPYRSLKEAGLHLSERERIAVTAERDMADRLKCRYMQTRIGERFRAIVSAIGDTLFFVDLLDHFISGSVLLSSLTDDYYLHDWKNHRLIGDVSGKIIRVGDLVEVQLVDVEIATSKIFFTLIAAAADT